MKNLITFLVDTLSESMILPVFSTDEESHNIFCRQREKNPIMWGISLKQLQDIRTSVCLDVGEGVFRTMTMRDICAKVISPICEKEKRPYALVVNKLGLKAQAFVTHSWDEPFGEFVDSLQDAMASMMKPLPLWICSFALHQRDGAIRNMLNVPLKNAPFVRVIKSLDRKVGKFIVVRNTKTDLYSRLWCVCELLVAKREGFIPDHTLVVGRQNEAFEHLSCLHAQASDRNDHEKIMRYMLKNFKSHSEIDEIIKVLREHPSNHAVIEDNRAL